MYKLGKKELTLRQEMRGRYATGFCWYSIMCHTGKEKCVARFLKDEFSEQHIPEVFLPILQPVSSRRSSSSVLGCLGAENERDKIDPYFSRGKRTRIDHFLFHSYLFLRCAMTDEIYSAVCDHPSVFQILGSSYRIPSVLDDTEIGNLKQILMSESFPELVTRRNIGDFAEVTDGLMAGIQGRIVAANAKEAKLEVSFSFLDAGTSIVIAIPRTSVRIRDEKVRLLHKANFCTQRANP